MLFKPKLQPKTRPVAFLYAAVFRSAFSMWLVLFLFLSFALQPIHQAYANEAAPEEPEDAPEPVAEPVAEHEDTDVTTDAEETANQTESPSDTSDTEDTADAAADDSSEQEAPVTTESPEDTTESPDTTTDSDEATAATTTDSTESAADDGIQREANDAQATSTDGSPTATSTVETSDVDATTTATADQTVGTTTSSSTPSDTELATTTDPTASSTVETVSTSTAATTSAPADTAPTSSDALHSTASTSSESAAPAGTATTASGGGTDNDVSDESTDDEVLSDANTNSDEEGASGSDGGSDERSEVPASTDEDETQVTATSGEQSREVVKDVEYLVTEENYYQFSKQSCVSVGDGAYHCSVNDEQVVDSKAVVYSELGPNDNQEIFIKTAKGEVEQLTDNVYEDSAPHYDPESMQIAWQRLIEGRYQIILYDVAEREETQLTFSRSNSMEPSVSDDGVVWQSWDGNDWEIMFFDGTYTDQLTDNGTQEISPVMEDQYIIWTVIGADSQYAQVYDLATEETMTITNYEGGAIVNPRFVLVYDTQFDNGDVVTQGFDPETGFSAPIAAQSGPEPVDIPDSDSTGETRALIQNKSTTKESGEVVQDDSDGTTGSQPKTSATSSEGVLDLTQASSSEVEQDTTENETDGSLEASTSTDAEADEQEYLELTEYDLILPATTSESAATPMSETASGTAASSSQSARR